MAKMLMLILLVSLFSLTSAFLGRPKIIDLTHPFNHDAIYWPTAKPFRLTPVFQGFTDQGFFYAANNFKAAEHGGTHLDAPFHFSENGQKVDEIPLDKFVGDACIVDVRAKAAADPDYLIGPDDISEAGIRAGCIVLLMTGWSDRWPNKTEYLGTSSRNTSLLHFPGLSHEGAKLLVRSNVKCVGIDTASIDFGQSKLFESHVILGAAGIPVLENVANIDRIEGKNATIVALPMKIEGGTGAPLRIVAFLREN